MNGSGCGEDDDDDERSGKECVEVEEPRRMGIGHRRKLVGHSSAPHDNKYTRHHGPHWRRNLERVERGRRVGCLLEREAAFDSAAKHTHTHTQKQATIIIYI